MARGNGKTSLLVRDRGGDVERAAGRPEGRNRVGGEQSFEQARIAFEHVLAFMGDELQNRSRWRVWDTGQQARIEDRKTLARVRCVGSQILVGHMV